MLTYSQAFYGLKNKLQTLYDEREAGAISHEILEHITGLGKMQRILKKDTLLNEMMQEQYLKAEDALLKGRPLQYVSGTAWFMGKAYFVNEHVLIPRPETEELVQWIIDDSQINKSTISILDIGTGSGCIAIALKNLLPDCRVSALDFSNEALSVASKNAESQGVEIEFLQIDILTPAERNILPMFDVIVSNPPYIPVSASGAMHINVKDFEPASALFVPDTDPLVFYSAIASFGLEHLNNNGYIYCETDSGHTEACKILFEQYGYSPVEIRKDMNGNWRMLKACLSKY
jgi:release factor glutamine methyltransferase